MQLVVMGERRTTPSFGYRFITCFGKPGPRKSAVEQFFQEVFDLNLEVGHSARDIASCTEEASKDITVATAIKSA